MPNHEARVSIFFFLRGALVRINKGKGPGQINGVVIKILLSGHETKTGFLGELLRQITREWWEGDDSSGTMEEGSVLTFANT